jgi:hypothetical protein
METKSSVYAQQLRRIHRSLATNPSWLPEAVAFGHDVAQNTSVTSDDLLSFKVRMSARDAPST